MNKNKLSKKKKLKSLLKHKNIKITPKSNK